VYEDILHQLSNDIVQL